MSDDLRHLFERSADEAPVLPPDVVARAADRGRALHRGRVAAICAATAAAVAAVAVLGPLVLRDHEHPEGVPVTTQPPASSPSAPASAPVATPTSTPPTSGPTVRVYVILSGSGLPYLKLTAPHRVQAPDSGEPEALRAVRALLELPRHLPWGFAGSVNGWAHESDDVSTRVVDVRHEAGTITVDLTGAPPPICEDCPPADLVLQQMTLTAQHAYASDDPVVVVLDGRRLRRW